MAFRNMIYYYQGLRNLYSRDGKFHATFKSGTEKKSADIPSHF